ncbi:MAG: TIGR01212 family radical SAM protein [Endomicrobiia bacterium]
MSENYYISTYMQLYYSFNNYLQEIFKERVHRISINAAFGCPNLDGTISNKGCIFCNNSGFAENVDNNLSVEQQIKNTLEFFSSYKRFRNIRKFIAYFQAYSNTYATLEKLKQTYDIIKKFPQIVGLFISTRPDCIDEEKLKLINSYTDSYLVWIEYGMQTSNNDILKWLNRGHSFEDFVLAVELTKKFSRIKVAAHIILGLPGQDVVKEAHAVKNLKLNGVKLHLLHVLKGTYLEKLYSENKISLLNKDQYVKYVCDFLENIPSDVVILRLISTAKKNYLVAPLWMNDRFSIIEEVKDELKSRNSFQGKNIS